MSTAAAVDFLDSNGSERTAAVGLLAYGGGQTTVGLSADSGGSRRTGTVGQWRLSTDSGGYQRTVAAINGRRRLDSRWTAAVSIDSNGSWRTAVIGLSADGSVRTGVGPSSGILANIGGGQPLGERRRQSTSWRTATALNGRKRSASWWTAEIRRQSASLRTAVAISGQRRSDDWPLGGRRRSWLLAAALGLSVDGNRPLGERRRAASLFADGGGRPRSSRTAAVGQHRSNGGGRYFKSSNHKK